MKIELITRSDMVVNGINLCFSVTKAGIEITQAGNLVFSVTWEQIDNVRKMLGAK